MPDPNDCNEKAKAAIRQVETPLNKSGGAAQQVRSPWTTPGSVTKTPESLNIHDAPYINRERK
jgi:hypothetical protein